MSSGHNAKNPVDYKNTSVEPAPLPQHFIKLFLSLCYWQHFDTLGDKTVWETTRLEDSNTACEGLKSFYLLGFRKCISLRLSSWLPLPHCYIAADWRNRQRLNCHAANFAALACEIGNHTISHVMRWAKVKQPCFLRAFLYALINCTAWRLGQKYNFMGD